jgi:hypothetical protein
MLIVDDAITDFEMTPDVYMSKTIPSELPYNKKSKLVSFNFNDNNNLNNSFKSF